MTFLLDMKTIFIALVVGHLFAMILISAYWQNHKSETILNNFFIGKSIQAASWLLLTIRNGIPDLWTVSVSNSLLFIGYSLEAVAILKLRSHYNKRTKKYYLFLTIINIIAFHVVLFVNNLENLRIAVASIGLVAVTMIPAYRLLTEKKTTVLSRIMGYAYALLIVAFIFRTVLALFTKENMGFFTPGINQTFSFLALYVVMTFSNIGFILLLKENTDKELLRLASYDDLTKIFNRRAFILKAEEFIRHCVKNQKPLTYLLFDIDYFKEINDEFGHVVGDRVLQYITKRIGSLIGNDQLFGRYGGDEFAILLSGLEQSQAIKFAEQVRKSIVEEIDAQELPTCTLSIGLTTVMPDKLTNIEQLYIKSDKALYSAKRQGRNCVVSNVLENID